MTTWPTVKRGEQGQDDEVHGARARVVAAEEGR